MGKRGGTKNAHQSPASSHKSVSLRQESTGRLQTKSPTARNPKSFFKLDHLQNLSVWAATEASIPSLSAFYGRRFAASCEAFGVPPDPSLISCLRCENLLQPGFNCTVRIERNCANRKRRSKKQRILTQNSVVYFCHFCSHRNVKRGTTKGYMQEICPSKPKQKTVSKPKPSTRIPDKPVNLENASQSQNAMVKTDEIALPSLSGDDACTTNSLATPLVRTGATLLDVKKRKRNRSGAKKSGESEDGNAAEDGERTASQSSKRKRKSWTGLKEISEINAYGRTQNVANLAIPFFI